MIGISHPVSAINDVRAQHQDRCSNTSPLRTQNRVFFSGITNLVSEVMKGRHAVQSRFTGFLRNFPFPLPPLAEQHRIVAKVDELMALCDELEARQKAKRETRERLVASALDKLTSARDAVEFDDYWHRLRDHFDFLFDHPSTIPPLRQAVLQIAVQGKLVPQNPKEEPASVLRSLIQSKRGDLWGLGEDSNGATDTGRSKDCPNPGY